MIHDLEFALTTYCQAKCRSCARTNPNTGDKADWLKLQHMNFDMYKQLLKNNTSIAGTQGKRIVFCGEFGDPMMHPQIEDFINYTTDNVDIKRLIINTNGGLRDPEWYKHIAARETVRIEWGIDGTDHDTNWLYREGVDWNRAMANMKAWFSNGGSGHWAFLLFDWNWHQIPTAVAMAQEIGCQLDFKINFREWGLLTPENRTSTVKLLKEYGYDV